MPPLVQEQRFQGNRNLQQLLTVKEEEGQEPNTLFRRTRAENGGTNHWQLHCLCSLLYLSFPPPSLIHPSILPSITRRTLYEPEC